MWCGAGSAATPSSPAPRSTRADTCDTTTQDVIDRTTAGEGGPGLRDEDLAPFAVADGLLARIASERPGKLTEVEHRHLLDVARENLARGTGETLEMAGKAMFKAADSGEFTVQCGERFAVVAIYGCVLAVYTRVELASICHPERN